MSPKKFLSDKKISAQTISISPALKDWIESYVRKMHENNPEDERYKSISAFYCEIMEKVLQNFEKGKTLDDLREGPDHKIQVFWDKIIFRKNIISNEAMNSVARYSKVELNQLIRYLLTFRRAYMNSVRDGDLYEELKNYYERIMLFSGENIIDSHFLDIKRGKTREEDKAILEQRGRYNYSHYEKLKADAMIAGILGIEIVDFIYSENDFYGRFDLKPTALLFEEKLSLNKRKDLIKKNLDYLINFSRIIKDKDYHLWIQMAEDNEVSLSFRNKSAFYKWIYKIKTDIEKYEKDKNPLKSMLILFERLHWIRIDYDNEYGFQFLLPESEYARERKYLLDYVSKHAKLEVKDGKYYLKEK